jgi:hypothetical protein
VAGCGAPLIRLRHLLPASGEKETAGINATGGIARLRHLLPARGEEEVRITGVEVVDSSRLRKAGLAALGTTGNLPGVANENRHYCTGDIVERGHGRLRAAPHPPSARYIGDIPVADPFGAASPCKSASCRFELPAGGEKGSRSSLRVESLSSPRVRERDRFA